MQDGGWSTIIMIVALFAIFYFMMIRPQQKKQKEVDQFRNGIRKGDKVVTAGGIHGVLRQVKDTTFIVEIDKNVCIEVEKTSIYPGVNNTSKTKSAEPEETTSESE